MYNSVQLGYFSVKRKYTGRNVPPLAGFVYVLYI